MNDPSTGVPQDVSARRPGGSTATPWGEIALVLVAYTAIAVWWLWPLPRLLGTHAGYFADHQVEAADFYLITWALAWDAHAIVTAPWRIFDANAFYPSSLSLAFSEHFLGYMPIFAPVYWATDNPILAVNVIVLTSYPLCGLAMYLLARRFTNGPGAAVAGFFYAFCIWRYHSQPHIHMLGVAYLPLVLLLSERWFEEARWRDAVLLAVVLILQALSSFYLAFVLALLYGPYLVVALWRWRARCDLRRLLGLGLVFVAVGTILGAVSLPYLELQRLGFIPSYGQEGHPWASGILFAFRAVRRYLEGEGVGPVGYALAFLAILPPWRARGWPVVLGVLAATVGSLVASGIHVSIGGYRVPNPYRLLLDWVPGFASVRVPSRFVIVAHHGFSVLAGLGLGRLVGRLPKFAGWALAVCAALVALNTFGELRRWPVHEELTNERVPAVYRWLDEHGEGNALMELPPAGSQKAAHRMYMSTYHWLPFIGGYSAYTPKAARYVYSLARGLPESRALQSVVDAVKIGWILVHLDELSDAERRRWNGPLPPGLERAGQWGEDLLLRVIRRGRKETQARLLSTEETLGGVPIRPLPDHCPGEIRLTVPPPDPWKPRSNANVEVEVRNTGATPWPARGFVPRHLVRLHVCLGLANAPGCPAYLRPLPEDVPAGGRITVPITLRGAHYPGRYVLHIGLTQVGVGPLERCGVKPLRLPVIAR